MSGLVAAWIGWVISALASFISAICLFSGTAMTIKDHGSLSSGGHTLYGGSSRTNVPFSGMPIAYQVIAIISFVIVFVGVLLMFINVVLCAKNYTVPRFLKVFVPILFGVSTLLFSVGSFVGYDGLLNGGDAYDIHSYCGPGGCYSASTGSEIQVGINIWLIILAGLMLAWSIIMFTSLEIDGNRELGRRTVASSGPQEETKSIRNYAFYKSLLTSYEVPNDIESIGDGAFSECKDLVSISFPKGLVSIGEYAFFLCESLRSVTLPKGLLSIGADAFSHCTNLESVFIPDSVTFIGNFAFFFNPNITIYCEAESQPSGWDKDWNMNQCRVVWGYKGK